MAAGAFMRMIITVINNKWTPEASWACQTTENTASDISDSDFRFHLSFDMLLAALALNGLGFSGSFSVKYSLVTRVELVGNLDGEDFGFGFEDAGFLEEF